MNISKRLQQIGDNVALASVVLDIGTDHALLPEYLIRARQAQHVIAGETNLGPYKRAKMYISNQSLTEQVTVRHGDGFAVLQEDDQLIDIVTIAGMGGSLICKILNLAPYQTRLVLQPMGAEYKLRSWLHKNNYYISDENILEEANNFYEIIVAEPIQHNKDKIEFLEDLNDLQLKFGPKLLLEKNSIFINKWQAELDKLLKQTKLIASKGRTIQAQQKLHEIEQIITEIKEVISND